MAATTSRVQRLGLILQNINLRPVNKLEFKFDGYHDRVASIREVVYLLHTPKIMDTNPKCQHKVSVVSDRSSPELTVHFNDGSQALFKTENLSSYFILGRLLMMLKERDVDTAKPVGVLAKKKSR